MPVCVYMLSLWRLAPPAAGGPPPLRAPSCALNVQNIPQEYPHKPRTKPQCSLSRSITPSSFYFSGLQSLSRSSAPLSRSDNWLIMRFINSTHTFRQAAVSTRLPRDKSLLAEADERDQDGSYVHLQRSSSTMINDQLHNSQLQLHR